eukprot:jgi/Botrbrau1/18763/Bobra.0386s0085.2
MPGMSYAFCNCDTGSKFIPRIHLQRVRRAELKRCRTSRTVGRFVLNSVEARAKSLKQAVEPDVPQILERIREALSLTVPRNTEVVYSGYGWHLGTKVNWRLRCRPDGAFLEEIKGREARWSWGYDGGRYSKCWEVDASGLSRTLELDDHEAVLLSIWVRTGFWLNPQISDDLGLRIVREQQGMEDHAFGAVVRTTALEEAKMEKELMPQTPLETTSVAPLQSSSAEVTIALQLPTGQVGHMLTISTETWRPMSLRVRYFQDTQTWHFSRWQAWDTSLHFPTETHHSFAHGGATNRLCTSTVKPETTASMTCYGMPVSPLRPADTWFNPRLCPEVAAWWAPSGHLLVRPMVNGQVAGFMIVDTGASGCVIDTETADRLGMKAFGELTISGMEGNNGSRFRTAASLQLGALHVKGPLFLELPKVGLVLGSPGPVVGIIGYDQYNFICSRSQHGPACWVGVSLGTPAWSHFSPKFATIGTIPSRKGRNLCQKATKV